MKRFLAAACALLALCGCGLPNGGKEQSLTPDSALEAESPDSPETPDKISTAVSKVYSVYPSDTGEQAQSETDSAEDTDTVTDTFEDAVTDSDSQTDAEDSDIATQADISWFDDCVFIGDSLMVGLEMYNGSTGALGNAQFLCSVGLNYGNSQWEIDNPYNVHPTYNGEKVLAEDAGVLTGANKAIISMGINDIAVWNPERGVENARELVGRIRAKSPDMIIYLDSVKPMVSYAQKEGLTNDLIDEFNERLCSMAEEEGCIYLNSHDAIADTDGSLPDNLCGDPNGLGIHLTYEGSGIWARFIKENVFDPKSGE